MATPKVLSGAKPLGNKRARYTLATQYPGQPGYSDSTAVTAHVGELISLGLPATSIARVANMHEEAVRNIANGIHPVVYTRHAEALMAVTFRPIPEQVRVIAIGAMRRLRALCALGWTSGTIAEHSTLSDKVLWSLINGRHATTTYEIWAEVRHVFELLSGTPGPSPIGRSRAVGKGWHAPLDWDGDDTDIDDPRVTPVVLKGPKVTNRISADDRREQVRALLGGNLTVQQIADRVGVSERTALRYLAEIRRANAA